MALELPFGVRVLNQLPVEDKYLNNGVPYNSVTQVNSLIPSGTRYIGLTVNINNVEYWYANGIGDGDLVIKTSASGSTGGSGERIERGFTQIGNDFVVGEVVAMSGNTLIRAIADGTQDAETYGIITQTGDTFIVVFAGYIDTFNPVDYGISAGNTYFLSPTTAGELTPIEPSGNGQISQPILHADSNSSGLVFQYRGFSVSTGNTGGGVGVSGLTDVFNIGDGLDVGQSISGDTLILRTIAGTGNTFTFIENDTIYIGVSGVTGSAGAADNVGDGDGLVFSGSSGGTNFFRSLKAVSGLDITTSGDTILFETTGNAIGNARDGDYSDGLFNFSPSTPTGFAIDDINEFLSNLAPTPAPNLTNITQSSGSFFAGKLSFGTSNPIATYFDVTTAASNSAVNTNGIYIPSSTRLGITKTGLSGILNDNVAGDVSGIPFLPNAFGNAISGELVLELNGGVVSTLDLTSSTGALSVSSGGTVLSVSARDFVKFDNGTDFTAFSFRTGTFTINTSAMRNGFNYLRITHAGISPTQVTNYLEWVYDPEGSNITITGEDMVNVTLTGSQFLSGVEYNTSGSVDVIATASNVYRNVFSSSSNAVTFVSTQNISNSPSSISITGSGVVNGSSQALPNLDTTQTDPEITDIDIDATLPINQNIILGNNAASAIEAAIAIGHPFPDEEATSTLVSENGFLIYNISQTSDESNENFNGEVDRLLNTNYVSVNYSSINGGSFEWQSDQDLIGGNSFHNDGLLVFNGELMYPNSSYLNTQYGIANGNFNAMTYSPASNANYSTASGIREYYRKFKSSNTTTQSTITIVIEHSGSQANFLTDGSTAGTPSGNDIKIEFLIKRSGGQTHGWANPFASSGNPEGIANLSTSTSGGVTTVQATLSVVPRIANDDIVVLKVRAASGWTNVISNIEITNI